MNIDVPNLIERLRASDTQVFDNAFDELCENIQTVKKSIYKAVVKEKNPHAKGALIELLGESRDAAYVPYLGRQLKSDESEVMFWSYVALKRIGTDQAQKLTNNRKIQTALAEIREKERSAGCERKC